MRFFRDLPARRKVDAVILTALPMRAERGGRGSTCWASTSWWPAGGCATTRTSRSTTIEAARLAVGTSLDLGHRRIAMIRTSDAEGRPGPPTSQRVRAWRDALAAAGHPPPDDLLVTVPFGAARRRGGDGAAARPARPADSGVRLLRRAGLRRLPGACGRRGSGARGPVGRRRRRPPDGRDPRPHHRRAGRGGAGPAGRRDGRSRCSAASEVATSVVVPAGSWSGSSTARPARCGGQRREPACLRSTFTAAHERDAADPHHGRVGVQLGVDQPGGARVAAHDPGALHHAPRCARRPTIIDAPPMIALIGDHDLLRRRTSPGAGRARRRPSARGRSCCSGTTQTPLRSNPLMIARWALALGPGTHVGDAGGPVRPGPALAGGPAGRG